MDNVLRKSGVIAIIISFAACGGEVPWQILPNPDQPPIVAGITDEVVGSNPAADLGSRNQAVPQEDPEDVPGDAPTPSAGSVLPTPPTILPLPKITTPTITMPNPGVLFDAPVLDALNLAWPTPPPASSGPKLIKYGDPESVWPMLYDLTGHILQAGGPITPLTMDSEEVGADVWQLTMRYQITGAPHDTRAPGHVTIVRSARFETTPGAIAMRDDYFQFAFSAFAYQHPCFGPLRVDGALECGGDMGTTGVDDVWTGFYACRTMGTPITLTVVGVPHAVTFSMTKSFDGPLQVSSSYAFTGTMEDNGIALSVPALVDPGVLHCVE